MDRECDRQGVFQQLATELGGSAPRSLLLEIFRGRSRARTPAEVLAQYRRDRFVAHATVDLREALAIDLHLLATAEGFAAIELSPVTPLGTLAANRRVRFVASGLVALVFSAGTGPRP